MSGHYYFRDNYNADSGFIPALLVLDLMARKKATMAELLEPLRKRYFISGEINSTVDDPQAAFARLRSASPTVRSATSTGSRSTIPTGTSTCVRPTRSLWCASISAPTARGSWKRSATRCWE